MSARDETGGVPPGQHPDPLADEDYRLAVVDLLGALAYGELTAFERLAEDSKLAPGMRDKAAISAMASAEFGHFQALHDGLLALGEDPFEAMEPFRETYERFHAKTAPRDWLEGLVKAYVGDGLAADFYRGLLGSAQTPAVPAGQALRSARRELWRDLRTDASPEVASAWAAYQHYGDPGDRFPRRTARRG